jgi:hypothetical protein
VTDATTAAAEHVTKGGAAPAEELGKEIFCIHAATSATLFKTFLPILVVDVSFVGVAEGFVSMRKVLELVFCFGALVLV